MNTKSFRLNVPRPVTIVVSLALLITFASALLRLAGLASERRGAIATSQTCPPGTFGTETDVLDIEGVWDLTYGYSGGFTFDPSSGHPTPAGSPVVTYQAKFYRTGPGTSLGYKFRGEITFAPSPHGGLGNQLFGEAFYDHRGVYVVQIREEDSNSPGRYYGLLSGAHVPYKAEPARVEIRGGWVNVGNSTCGGPGGSPYVANFVMVKRGKSR
jgi:hypothetical protein